jgi:predicted aspartyl protease/Tfp pilus assembly protein PilF
MFLAFPSFQQRQFFSSLARKTQYCFALVCFFLFCLTTVVSNNETQTDELRKQAERAMRNGDFAAAETLWQEILRAEPKNIQYRLALSYTYYKQRKLVESFEEAMRVAEKDQQNARVRSIIGAVYLAAGRFSEARDVLKAALILAPDEPLALANSALLDFYENRAMEGLPKLRRAAYLEPNEPDFVFAQAQLASRTENYKEAADAYTKFLRIAPATDVERRERIEGLIKFLRYLGGIKSLYNVSGERETTVECQIINNRPVIEVHLNENKETLRFVLDTGSGMTVISDETAQRLRIKQIVRGGMARAVGGGGKFQIVYGFVDSLKIGDTQIQKIPVYIRPFHSAGDKFDGYIGLSVISKFITTLDYGNKTFSLVRNIDYKKNNIKPELQTSMKDNSTLTVPLRTTSSGFLSSEAKIEGVKEPLNFILDTGASVSVVSAEAARHAEINRFTQSSMLKIYGAAGITENVSTLLLPRLTFGQISRENVMAAVLDLASINETAGFEQSGILGGNFLLYYRLTLNFQNSTVTFNPINK